jgi:hypothetical protein
MRTRPTLTAALASALALVLGGCSRDVTLPPEATAPRIASFSPDAAWAGERITIVASGLDAAPEANLVQFPSAVARGESLSGGALVVRVPADAGTGAIAIEASGGLSAPAGPFTYRGLGQLRSGAVTGEVPLLHKPYRILAVGGDTFLHSDLLLALVRYADPAFAIDLAVAADALPWAGAGGAVVWLESEWYEEPEPDVSRLVRLDLATGARVTWPPAPAPPPAPPPPVMTFAEVGPIVALRGPSGAPDADRIAVLRSDAGVTVALHDADTLVELQAPVALPSVAEVRGCADAGEGRLACLVREVWDAPLTLALVIPGPSPAVQPIALPAGDVIREDAVDRAGPICAGRTSAGAGTAAVGLEDGRLALAALDGSPAFWGHLETGSRTPARSLACAAIGSRLVVLAPKLADDLLVAVDAETETILWSVDVPRASRAAVDPAWGTVHAAGEGDNRVLVLEAATGALLARRSFDVLPGRDGAAQAAAWIPAGDGYPAELVFGVGSPPGVIELPLTAAPGTFPIYRNRPDAVGVFGPFAPYDPGYRYYFTLREEGAAQAGTEWDVGSAAQLGQDGRRDAYLGTAGGLVTLDYDGGWNGTWAPSGIPGAEFVSMGLLPDALDPDDPAARVFAAVGDPDGWTVRAWSEARAAAGGAAEWSWAAPDAIAGAARLDGVLWTFHWQAGAFVGTQLDATLRKVRSVAMPEAFDRILAVSPNGRTFVTWEYQPWSWETSVVVWAAEGAGWERIGTVPLPGVVSGVAFAGTGEALYVLTRSPDRVVVLE